MKTVTDPKASKASSDRPKTKNKPAVLNKTPSDGQRVVKKKQAQTKPKPRPEKKRARLNDQALQRLLQQGNVALRAGQHREAARAFKRWLRAAGRDHPDRAKVNGRLRHSESKIK